MCMCVYVYMCEYVHFQKSSQMFQMKKNNKQMIQYSIHQSKRKREREFIQNSSIPWECEAVVSKNSI